MKTWLLVQEFLFDLKNQKTRAFLTTFAVAWGTFSVVMLLAFGEGLALQMQKGLLANGDNIIRIYGGNSSIDYKGLPKGRSIRLHPEDAKLLLDTNPDIDMASPAYGRRLAAEYNGKSTTSGYTVGVNPGFEDMRRMYPLAGGRFLNEIDVEHKRRVAFLGAKIAEQLFGDEDPVGKDFKLENFTFRIVGTMAEKFQNNMSNGPDDRRIVIPHTTFNSIWPRRSVWYIALRPRISNLHMSVRQRAMEILGAKYRFDPKDDRALYFNDSVENAATTRKIFDGIQIFLGAVGGMTLFIAGVGIANIMYVVVKERTREIGIKRAIGARRRHIVSQFMLESILLTGVGGFFGLGFALTIISLFKLIPTEGNGALEMIGTPTFSPGIAFFTLATLVSIGLFAGIYPARRASRIEPVEALRYE
ncbi:MAG: ABC transporter permease [Deferribacteres bacterium]|nr:ABC transporter permease [candidate division KSB1 bacterium]MCB9500435.1 ABC transporter permease [Deferribacteres bacterium]